MINKLYQTTSRSEELEFDTFIKQFLIKLYLSFDQTQNNYVISPNN